MIKARGILQHKLTLQQPRHTAPTQKPDRHSRGPGGSNSDAPPLANVMSDFLSPPSFPQIYPKKSLRPRLNCCQCPGAATGGRPGAAKGSSVCGGTHPGTCVRPACKTVWACLGGSSFVGWRLLAISCACVAM